LVKVVNEKTSAAVGDTGAAGAEEIGAVVAGNAVIGCTATGFAVASADRTLSRNTSIAGGAYVHAVGVVEEGAGVAGNAGSGGGALGAGIDTGGALKVGSVGVGLGWTVLLADVAAEVELRTGSRKTRSAVSETDRTSGAGGTGTAGHTDLTNWNIASRAG
jgi:hypothetical protein